MKLTQQKYKNIYIFAPTTSDLVRVKRSLRMIREYSPRKAAELLRLRALIVLNRKGYDNLLFPHNSVYVCKYQTVRESSVAYFASLLVHESIHIRQFRNGQKYYGSTAEKEAYTSQRKFLYKYGSLREVEWLDQLFENDKWWIFKTNKKVTHKEHSRYTSPHTQSFENQVKKHLKIIASLSTKAK